MCQRRHLVLFAATFVLMGARYQTANFVVDAPNAQVAQQVGQYAEHYRKEKACRCWNIFHAASREELYTVRRAISDHARPCLLPLWGRRSA